MDGLLLQESAAFLSTPDCRASPQTHSLSPHELDKRAMPCTTHAGIEQRKATQAEDDAHVGSSRIVCTETEKGKAKEIAENSRPNAPEKEDEELRASIGESLTLVASLAETEKGKAKEIAENARHNAPEKEDGKLRASFGESLTLVASLASCAKEKDVQRGFKLHADVVGKGLFGKNAFIESALVNMYAKCYDIAKAKELLDDLPVRSVVSWNAVIAGYSQQGYAEEALACFDDMRHEGFSPDSVTFASILKACGSIQQAEKGRQIHALVVREGLLEKDIVVANALVDMYAKCRLLGKTLEVFYELPFRDIVSWNVLIHGCTQLGHAEIALDSFDQMRKQGFCPDAFTFVCILKVFASLGDAERGQEIHAEIIKGIAKEGDTVVGSALVDMYSNCHMLADAHNVLEELPSRNVVLWTALIEGYVQHSHVEKAFTCYQQMRDEGILPDILTIVCILKAYGSVRAAFRGQELHAEIVRDEIQDQDTAVGTALVDMYASCGMLAECQEVFDELAAPNAASWTALLAVYVHSGHDEEAINCYRQMRLEGFSPDVVTFACILKACGCIAALDKGQEAHSEIVMKGFLDGADCSWDGNNAVVGALVGMYSKCGLLADAEYSFFNCSVRDRVSWSALASGYAQHGRDFEAVNCVEQMRIEGLSPDAVTFACILNACGKIDAAFRGKEIHSDTVKAGWLEKDVTVGTAVVHMYAKCGMIDEAQDVFDRLPVWDVFSWTAIIAGYAQHAHHEEALMCLEQMEVEGISPNTITYTSILKACGSIGALCRSHKLHSEVVRHGLLDENMFVGTALVDMYANCGMVVEAQDVFDRLPVHSQISWNTLITGHVLVGQDELVFDMFKKFIAEGNEPDMITFTLILNTCSNRGLVDKGQAYFEAMSTTFGIIPTLEHCNCIVDLFGRVGHIDMAIAVIAEIPVLADPAMWLSVLAACQKRSHVNLGQWAFKHAAESDERDGAAYVFMSNILYSAPQECIY